MDALRRRWWVNRVRGRARGGAKGQNRAAWGVGGVGAGALRCGAVRCGVWVRVRAGQGGGSPRKRGERFPFSKG